MMNFKEGLNHKDELISDQYLKFALQQVFDQELRKDVESTLAKQYGITKNQNLVSETSATIIPMSFIKKMIAAAAIVVTMFFAYKLIGINKSLSEQAAQYASHIEQHPGVTKGNETIATLAEAIKAYNNKDWKNASNLFSMLHDQNHSTKYYAALSLFYNKEYPKAIAIFIELENSTYSQEAQWFLGLSYILNGAESKGKSTLQTITKDEWMYREAQTLLK